MTPQKNTSSKQMALFALCAAILAILAFFLPMISVGEGNYSMDMDGFELLGDEELIEYNTSLIIGLIGASIAVLFALMGMSDPKMLSIAAAGADVGAVGVFIAFQLCIDEIKLMDYAAIGFWLFVIAEVACVVLSVMGMNKAKTE